MTQIENQRRRRIFNWQGFNNESASSPGCKLAAEVSCRLQKLGGVIASAFIGEDANREVGDGPGSSACRRRPQAALASRQPEVTHSGAVSKLTWSSLIQASVRTKLSVAGHTSARSGTSTARKHHRNSADLNR